MDANERIERAQSELNAACSELSAVVGMVKPWEDCGKLSDRVKAFWHKLNGRFLSREGWKLDRAVGAACRHVDQTTKSQEGATVSSIPRQES